MHRDAGKALAFAWRAIEAKLANAAAVLAGFGDRAEAHAEATEAALAHLAEAKGKASFAATIEILDGIEAAAARLYFNVLLRRNKSLFEWPGRVKHPATDPINALLSFGYTLVTNELPATIETLGLDSYLGCLHQLDYGRQSLALDLVEPGSPLQGDCDIAMVEEIKCFESCPNRFAAPRRLRQELVGAGEGHVERPNRSAAPRRLRRSGCR